MECLLKSVHVEITFEPHSAERKERKKRVLKLQQGGSICSLAVASPALTVPSFVLMFWLVLTLPASGSSRPGSYVVEVLPRLKYLGLELTVSGCRKETDVTAPGPAINAK